MLRYLSLSLLVCASLFLNGCDKNNQSKHEKSQQQRTKSNLITLQGLDKKEYTFIKKENGLLLKDNGKILIIDIFATWCPPCQAESQVLSHLQEKYSNDIKIFGISVEENLPVEKLQAFKQSHNAQYTFLIPNTQNKELIEYIASNVLHKSNNIPLPLVVIYKDGKLMHYYIGATEEEFIESDIKQLRGK